MFRNFIWYIVSYARIMVAFIAVMALILLGSIVNQSHEGTLNAAPEEPPAAQGQQVKPPIVEEDKLYVWTQPEQGLQSVLVLRVVDAETVEVAYLSPTVVRLALKIDKKHNLTAKTLTEALEKEIGGRVLHANLKGRDTKGLLQADLWLGKKDGWISEKWSK